MLICALGRWQEIRNYILLLLKCLQIQLFFAFLLGGTRSKRFALPGPRFEGGPLMRDASDGASPRGGNFVVFSYV